MLQQFSLRNVYGKSPPFKKMIRNKKQQFSFSGLDHDDNFSPQPEHGYLK